jgi:hypothetical protein
MMDGIIDNLKVIGEMAFKSNFKPITDEDVNLKAVPYVNPSVIDAIDFTKAKPAWVVTSKRTKMAMMQRFITYNDAVEMLKCNGYNLDDVIIEEDV